MSQKTADAQSDQAEQLARELGAQRLQYAIECLSRADGLVREAWAEGLGPIVNGAAVYARLGDLANRVRLAGLAVETLRDRLQLRGGAKVDRAHVDIELERRAQSSEMRAPRGLYRKYNVRRTDGRLMKGGDFIVLEVGDPRAWPALEAWADAVEKAGNAELAQDVRALVEKQKDS